jgi:hypothetical protein
MKKATLKWFVGIMALVLTTSWIGVCGKSGNGCSERLFCQYGVIPA